MAQGVSNVGIGLSPAGESVASGAEFCLDRGVGQTQHFPGQIIIDSTARDARRNPNTTLEKGLALGRITASGRYTGYDPDGTDGTDTARGVLDETVHLLDGNGTAQHHYHASMMIRGLYDLTLVFDEDGTAIDANGRTDIGTLTNGAAMIPI